jgi:hypothetical protein
VSVRRTAVLIAPYWGRAGHVGVYRVDRFRRWLAAGGMRVVIVRAGSRDWVAEHDWGAEVAVRDPFGFYPDQAPGNAEGGAPVRKANRWRRRLGLALFTPDPTVVWARRAASHRAVLAHASGAALVLSSSPAGTEAPRGAGGRPPGRMAGRADPAGGGLGLAPGIGRTTRGADSR